MMEWGVLYNEVGHLFDEPLLRPILSAKGSL